VGSTPVVVAGVVTGVFVIFVTGVVAAVGLTCAVEAVVDGSDVTVTPCCFVTGVA
jgi:hypothetical protein